MRKDLKADVMEVLDESVKLLLLTEEEAVAAGFDLSAEVPAQCLRIPGGWQILVLKSLPVLLQAEAASHKLGHLLLKGEGLAEVSLGDDWPEKYLAQEINSVLTHHFLIGRLKEDYGIASVLLIGLRKQLLDIGEEVIRQYEDETVMLHGLGLHLLDLELTTEGNGERIRELLALSPAVEAAYVAGREHLVLARHDLSVEEQWAKIKGFLHQLGYDSRDARICG